MPQNVIQSQVYTLATFRELEQKVVISYVWLSKISDEILLLSHFKSFKM